jgi:peptide/nickel transport system permease protein
MLRFLTRRFLQAILVLLGVTLVTFILTHLIPGGVARSALGVRATRAQIHQFNQRNGYLLPFWDQYVRLLNNYLHGNFGYSYKLNQSVSSLIAERLPKTLILAGMATILALVVAVPLGVYQATHRFKPSDYVLTGSSFILYAMPAFLLGQLLILYFADDLKIFPFEAPQAATVGGILSDPRGLVLPVVTLTAVNLAAYSRYMRSSMMEALSQDYIRTARAKGGSPRRVTYLHALRNALLPIITLVGLSVPAVVGGAILTESVFNYPGMGLLTYNAISQADVPLLIGITLVATLATVLGSLLADTLYAAVDPRIRLG